MTLEQRRKQIIDVIDELFESSDEIEAIAMQIEEKTEEWWNYIHGSEYYKGKASGYLQSARRLMKLKRKIEIEMKH